MNRLPLMAIGLTACLTALGSAASEPSLTLEIKDFVELPITGKLDGTGQSDGMLARMNSLREEPGGANRFFINDVNGPMYIIDKATRKITTYLDFNGRDGHTGQDQGRQRCLPQPHGTGHYAELPIQPRLGSACAS